jgi:bacillithiol system protein YtxJ
MGSFESRSGETIERTVETVGQENGKEFDMGLIEIKTEEELEKALGAEKAIIFKHSPICGISARAQGEVERFVRENEDVPVYLVDVREQRPLSMQTAEHFGIRHESPQIIVVKNGRPAWDGSHSSITADRLEQIVNDEF